MSEAEVRVFDTMSEAAAWAVQMEGQGFSVAVADRSQPVRLRYKNAGVNVAVKSDSANAFPVMAYNPPRPEVE